MPWSIHKLHAFETHYIPSRLGFHALICKIMSHHMHPKKHMSLGRWPKILRVFPFEGTNFSIFIRSEPTRSTRHDGPSSMGRCTVMVPKQACFRAWVLRRSAAVRSRIVARGPPEIFGPKTGRETSEEGRAAAEDGQRPRTGGAAAANDVQICRWCRCFPTRINKVPHLTDSNQSHHTRPHSAPAFVSFSHGATGWCQATFPFFATCQQVERLPACGGFPLICCFPPEQCSVLHMSWVHMLG